MRYKVLVIEDDTVDQMAFKRFVMDENPPYDYAVAGSVSEVKRILGFKRFDVVITDYMLGDGTAFDIFGLIKDIPIIIVTGSGNEKIAVEAMKAGACDYLIKDPERNYLKILPITVENAIKHKRLEEQFGLLSYALTSINDSVNVTDMDDKIIFVNKAFCETYGYVEEDIVGMNSNILGESGLKGEFNHRRKDGGELWVSLSRSVITDENGKEIAIVGVARDITERKRIEKELFRLASIPEENPSPIIELDFRGNVTYLNPAALREFPDLQVLGLEHPILEGLRSTIDAFRKGELESFAREINLGNAIYGQKLWYTPENNIIRIYMADITERKRMEESLRRSEEQYRLITENSHDLICVIDLKGTYTYVSPSYKETLEYSPEELLGTNAFSLIHPEDLDRVMKEFQESLANKTLGRAEFRYKDRKGGWHIFESVGNWILDKYGNPQRDVIVSRDITERKRAEKAIQRANEELANSVKRLQQRNHKVILLNEMSDLLQTCLNMEEAYTVISKFAHQLFPTESGALCIVDNSRDSVETVAVWGESPPNELVFKPDECWALRRSKIHAVENPCFDLLCKHLSHLPPAGYQCVPVMAQGEAMGILYLENGPKEISQPNEQWERLMESARQQLVMTLARNIGLSLANLKLRETLLEQATRDSLTGLFNRRYMEESLIREVHRAERKGTPLGVIMLDLDLFKQFNDTFGHAVGDALLRELGSFVQAHIRRADIACRYGGDEFMLILPETSLDGTRQRAEQLREEIKHLSVQYNGQSIKAVTLSLGVAVFPEHGSTADAILQAADLALYQAKGEGHDRVVVGQTIVNSERLFQHDVASPQTV